MNNYSSLIKTYNIFDNYNKKVYISNKTGSTKDDYYNELSTYSTPFKLGNFNYQPLVGQDLYAYMSAYGETKNKLIRLFLDKSYKDKVKEFDLAYLYGANPQGEEINGENANYYIKTCAEQNTKIMVVFEEIIKEEN